MPPRITISVHLYTFHILSKRFPALPFLFLSLSQSPVRIGSFWTSKSSLKTTITPARIQDSVCVTKNHWWKVRCDVLGPKKNHLRDTGPDGSCPATSPETRNLQRLFQRFYNAWKVGGKFYGDFSGRQPLRTNRTCGFLVVTSIRTISTEDFSLVGPKKGLFALWRQKNTRSTNGPPYGFQPTFGRKWSPFETCTGKYGQFKSLLIIYLKILLYIHSFELPFGSFWDVSITTKSLILSARSPSHNESCHHFSKYNSNSCALDD